MTRRKRERRISRPFTQRRPVVRPYVEVPMRQYSRVLFPAPDGPITAVTCSLPALAISHNDIYCV